MGILPMSRGAILALPGTVFTTGETPVIHTGRMPVLLLKDRLGTIGEGADL
jgi:hypothetical protein